MGFTHITSATTHSARAHTVRAHTHSPRTHTVRAHTHSRSTHSKVPLPDKGLTEAFKKAVEAKTDCKISSRLHPALTRRCASRPPPREQANLHAVGPTPTVCRGLKPSDIYRQTEYTLYTVTQP
jgi:hypothetical protein